MDILVVTGGIGSGKSTTIEILENLNYPVFSSDQIVNELYNKRWVRKKLPRLKR